MWPISTRVNKPENDDPSILDERSSSELKMLNKMAGEAGIEPALARFWRPPLYR